MFPLLMTVVLMTIVTLVTILAGLLFPLFFLLAFFLVALLLLLLLALFAVLLLRLIMLPAIAMLMTSFATTAMVIVMSFLARLLFYFNIVFVFFFGRGCVVMFMFVLRFALGDRCFYVGKRFGSDLLFLCHIDLLTVFVQEVKLGDAEIGRASCRERV